MPHLSLAGPVSSKNRAVIALGLLAGLAAAAWKTMEPGKVRLVVMVILGSFALRILLASRRP
jgi:hypothetical protein